MEDVLQAVTDFADKAHGEQTRRYTPERYIAHPIRVMETCRQFTSDITILSAALLHDVLEDTSVTKEELKEFLLTVMKEEQATRTLDLVIDLTDVYIKKDYRHWNRRKRKTKEAERLSAIDAAAQTIKYADIIDNGAEIVSQDPDFAPVFLSEYKIVLQKMDKGNETLRARALEIVSKGLEELKGGR